MAFGRIASIPSLNIGAGGEEAGNEPLARGYARALCFCVVVLTVSRLLALAFSRTELFFDEAQYWFWSRELASGYYSKPPLIAWVIRASTELCGMGEACVRTPAPLIHGATAMLVYAIGRTLYDGRTGFWAGLVYVTLPGVSFSSTLISTDVPLLFFVALGLLAVVKLTARRTWIWAGVLGVAIGFGLLSKYAMSYFLLSLALYGLFTPEGRALFRAPHLYVALGIGAALIAPNIAWNAANKFATFAHTADNASWGGSLIHPLAALNFLGGQVGVFGPVLCAVLVVTCVNWLRRPGTRSALQAPERLLLAFSVPVLVLMSLQAFVARAHANWAAFAYIAATILITATMLRMRQGRLFRVSLGVHIAVFVALSVGGAFAGRLGLPLIGDPYARVHGWKAVAEAAGAKAEAEGFRAIATDRRALAAEFFYYLRERQIPIVALRQGDPRDHFELKRPLGDDTPRPILLASFRKHTPSAGTSDGQADADDVPDPGRNVLGAWAVSAGSAEMVIGGKRRNINFYAIKGSVE